MSVTMVRQKINDGSIEEAEAAVRELFATFDRVGLEGVLRIDPGGGPLDVRDHVRAG
jgi:hypothetical protein